jgi:3-oxoacyl-[acyl-carrier protein] reductase
MQWRRGVINTDMSNFARSEQGRAITLGTQALQRVGEADDVSSVVAFLAADAARWITGDTLRVDGGSKL